MKICKCGSWKVNRTGNCESCDHAERKEKSEQIKAENKIKKGGFGVKLHKRKIAKSSKNNFHTTSTGERFSKAQVDAKVAEAKRQKKEEFLELHGYIFCEDCNTTQQPIDTSHDLSVDECQKQGTVELAWYVPQLHFRCRYCHQVHDKNIINYK